MTAQVRERLLIDDVPYELQSTPLYRLLASRRIEKFPLDYDCYNTACYRRYLGTWELIDGKLYLVHLCGYGSVEEPLSERQRQFVLRLVPATAFPVFAFWFNGRLQIPLGRRLVYHHQGFSGVYERLRVLTTRQGKVIRDRIVDTAAMLYRHERRNEAFRRLMEGDTSDFPVAPLIFPNIDTEPFDLSDWWPPDYRPGQSTAATGPDGGGR